MKTLRLWMVGLVMLCAAAGAQAQVGLSAQDRQGIDATMDELGSDLYKLDFDGFGSLLTDDCDWINIVGMHWTGKAQVVKGHRSVFSTRYKGVMMHQLERSVSGLTPGWALVINKQRMGEETAVDGKPVTDNVSLMMVVLVKRDGKWLVRSGENVTIDARAALHDPVKMP